MKNTLPAFFLLLTPFFLTAQAQDTTIVQTFSWAADNRADTFDFPNDPNQSWRKIYMLYNMRCHNGTTGGCYEWDYSCNTFLTDPSRVDSTRQSFPDYVISGFSGSSFEYALQPTFTYYQYDQHQSQLTGTPLETVLGSGGLDLELAASSPTRKAQFLYSAAELAAAGLSAGEIFGLKLTVQQPGSDLGFFTIRLKNTPKSVLDPQDPDLQGFTEVYFNQAPFGTAGPVDFPFYQPFAWDGSSGLLVELSFTAASIAPAPVVLGTESGFPAALVADQRDYALQFGNGGYVEVPPGPLANLSDEITVALWTFGDPAVLPANTSLFEGNGADNNREINVHLPWSNGAVYWDCGGNGGNYDRIEKQANPADWAGQWNHWAFTKNATTGSMKIYLNGELWHSGTGKTNPIDLRNLVLGASYDLNLPYAGKVDEFQIWNKELDAATIKAWMRKAITPDHPDYAHLLTYYRFGEGQGNEAADSGPLAEEGLIHLPHWLPTRGADLFKDFTAGTERPDLIFQQGALSITDQILPVLDSVQNPQQRVLHYGVNGTDLVLLDTNFYYPAGPMKVIDVASDTVIGHLNAPADGLLEIQSLEYYDKRPARFELLSLVTPYGNGLNLGAGGKTFTFDVTDYAPLLQGKKFLSVEFGGEWQEELDVKFVFVKGVPAQPVLDIQNIWPEGRGWHQEIIDDRYFEPRTLHLSPQGQAFKLRSAVTGHGQNGEFVSRQHYLNVDGGNKEFQYDVWKYCGKNPIYPQGGTWIFDRAGWCPGMATDVHEFRLNAQPSAQLTLDYGINGAVMPEANYLVSNQLVTYGAPAHQLDASIEAIMRPNDVQVEYARINPACSTPLIRVKNSGKSPITSLQVQYEVVGGNPETYTWTGNLSPDGQVEITLPVLSTAFWVTDQSNKIFQARILSVNGQLADEEPANNQASMHFTQAPVHNFPNPLRLKTITNNNGGDYSYTIKDASGNTVMSRNQMDNNTAYVDLIDLPNGCYTLNFEDSGNDGLSFWYFPEYGSGSLNVMRLVNTVLVPVKAFNPDFGGGVQYDFVIGGLVGTESPASTTLLSLFPNPAHETLHLDLRGLSGEKLDITLSDVQGRLMRSLSAQIDNTEQFSREIPLAGLPAGMYFVRVTNGKTVWVEQVVKE